MIKNQLIKSYLEADKIKHQPTKAQILWHLQTQKEVFFKTKPLDDLREFNERIYPQSPVYGKLYE